MSENEPLMTLKTQADGQVATPADETVESAAYSPVNAKDDGLPLLGLFAVGFGVLGIFTLAPVFVPLALVFGLIAIFAGQILMGISAVGLALIGIITSPTLMLILGAGAFFAWLGIPIPF